MKKIISVICVVAMLFGMVGTQSTMVKASEERKLVDGSYLTMDDESTGNSQEALNRGIYLATGDCTISKAGRGRIYVYGSTTANRTVDYVSVTMSVEQYSEKDDEWHQIDAWDTEKTDSYFVSTSKSIVVDRGYYYRVHAVHYATVDGVQGDIGDSVTDGIMIP